MSKKHCKGCAGKNTGSGAICYFHSVNTDGSCPCTQCIIKVTCINDCDEIKNYATKAHYYINNKKDGVIWSRKDER